MAKRRKQLRRPAGSGALTAGSAQVAGSGTVKWRKLTSLVIEERRKQFKAGEDWALLDAVDLCARSGTPMPLWLVDAFCERYVQWRLFRAKTLDEAFKVTRKKGMHFEPAARREWLKPRVVLEVMRLRAEHNVPLGDGLFEQVGEKFGISRAVASEVYYDRENHWRTMLRTIESS